MFDASDATALLGVVASLDGREFSNAAILRWASALRDVDPSDAELVVRRHYARSRQLIEPGLIVRRVGRLERDRVAAAPRIEDLELPAWLDDLLDDPQFDALYAAWIKEQARRIRRGLPLDSPGVSNGRGGVPAPAALRELLNAS